MSARRKITIECDGPGCATSYPSNAAFVDQARESAKLIGWWKVGKKKKVGDTDFCTFACERNYLMEAGVG